MKRLIIISLSFLVIGFHLQAQNKIMEVECGDKIESEFTINKEWQSFQINLEAGDNLKIYSSSKYGDQLKYNMQIWAPSGNLIKHHANWKHIYQIESGVVPGSGKYAIHPYNFQLQGARSNGELGVYTIEFTCEKNNGDVISSTNKVSPSGSEIIEEKTQFLSIPLGTPMEGEIKAGSNQLFGFKTKVRENSQAAFDFSISEGNIPLEIQILEPNSNKIIFFCSLGNAVSQQATIKFPSTSEYIITIKESSSFGGNGTTKFKIILQ